MKIPTFLSRRLHWINLPGALLMGLLQRTPVLNVAAAVDEFVVASPAAFVFRSALTTLAALGTVNTLVGASTLNVSSGTSSGITVSAGSAMSVSFSLPGSDSTADPTAKWTLGIGTGSSFPPGLNFSGLTGSGTVSVKFPQLTGTPTAAGTFNLTLQAFSADNLFSSPIYPYSVTVTSSSNTVPAFTTQPVSQTVAPGSSVTFTAAAAGSPAPTYQWQRDGVFIAGATRSSFSIASVIAADGGSYSVIATNPSGSVTSNSAMLTVSGATSVPAFTTQPTSQTIAPGASVTFTAAANGSPAPTFQWQKNGIAITGATNSSFMIPSVTTADAATYTVVATNSAGSTTSNSATLTVSAATSAPAFTTQPVSQTVALGASVTFSVAANGSPAPTLQWQKSGVDLTGATGSSFMIPVVAAADAGNYTVIATNSAGSTTSNTAVLTISSAAGTPLANKTVTTGHNVTFSAGATGGSIQWQVSTDGGINWTKLTNDSTYSGTNTGTLTVANAGTSLNNAQYRFMATNGGMVVTSGPATLTVAQAFFPFPNSIAIDGAGNLYVSDSNADSVQKISSAGQITPIAGTSGTAGSADGTGTAARFNQPAGLALDSTGAIYVADTSNATIRRIGTDGAVITLAGSATNRGNMDGAGTAAMFSQPIGIAVDSGGVLYVADSMNDTIRKVTTAGVVTTFSGAAGVTGSADGAGTAARFNLPTEIAVNLTNGTVYVADTTNNTIRAIASTGAVSTLAGVAGVGGFTDGTGAAALFNHPGALTVDSAGNIYLADTGNSVIRKITPAGAVTTLAGLPGIAGLEDGNGSNAFFNQPQGLAVDSGGNVYVADTGNAAIRKITPAGVVTTLNLSAAPAPSPAPAPTPAPAPAPSPSPMPQPSSGGGGGGAIEAWFATLFGLLLLLRRMGRHD